MFDYVQHFFFEGVGVWVNFFRTCLVKLLCFGINIIVILYGNLKKLTTNKHNKLCTIKDKVFQIVSVVVRLNCFNFHVMFLFVE